MSKLVIIRGNSGSGKSSAAQELQRRLGENTLLICQDVLRRDILRVKDGPGTRVLPLMADMLQYGKRHCAVVILEGILRADWYHELFELALREFPESIFAYYYDLSFEETLRRHQTRPKRFEFGEADLRRWWNERDYIGFIPEKMITHEIGLEEVVSLIYNELADAVL